jgi:S-adenosylmethionine/arginine decarboxylase-like enzyme
MNYVSKKHFNENEYWGLSTCVDLYNCSHKIRYADEIEKYVIELCDLIDMRRFGECKVIHFGDDPKVEGFSMTQLIETSLISGHFANKTMSAYLDIFSCKWYDQRVVEAFSKEFFSAEACETKVNIRK